MNAGSLDHIQCFPFHKDTSYANLSKSDLVDNMPIKKQEFYEGAAIYRLARNAQDFNIQYRAPFFLINKKRLIFLKYSTQIRSPWAFTFTVDEQAQLHDSTLKFPIVIGLICGADGVAALNFRSFQKIAPAKKTALHIACRRSHGSHYEISGPKGKASNKISPSAWQKILENRAIKNEAC